MEGLEHAILTAKCHNLICLISNSRYAAKRLELRTVQLKGVDEIEAVKVFANEDYKTDDICSCTVGIVGRPQGRKSE